jgi:hypothetical protein
MHLYGKRVFKKQGQPQVPAQAVRGVRLQAGQGLRAIAAVMLTLTAGVPS